MESLSSVEIINSSFKMEIDNRKENLRKQTGSEEEEERLKINWKKTILNCQKSKKQWN
jgi:hypothetical protein